MVARRIKIAYACRNGGDFQICVMNLGTGQALQLTEEGSNGHPSWSPDGTKIAFDSRRGSSTRGLHHGHQRRAQDRDHR